MLGKIIKYVLLGIAIVVGLYLGQKVLNLFYENKKLHEDLIGQQQKYEQLNKYSAKLEIKYKNQTDLLEHMKKDWEKEKDKLKGQIKVLAQASFSMGSDERKSDKSDAVVEGKYLLNEIRFNDGPPVGYVVLYTDGKVDSKLYTSEIRVNTIVTKDDESGKYNIASKADYVLKENPKNTNNKSWKEKAYPLPIVGGNAIIDPVEEIKVPTSRFYLFAPKLSGGIHIYTDNVIPYFGLSLMGIGPSKRDLSWKFIEIGMEYSKSTKFAISFTPVLYRPFPSILSNTYVGIGASWNATGRNYFLELSVGF